MTAWPAGHRGEAVPAGHHQLTWPPAWLARHEAVCGCGALVIRVHLYGSHVPNPQLVSLSRLARGKPVRLTAAPGSACIEPGCGCQRPFAWVVDDGDYYGVLHYCRHVAIRERELYDPPATDPPPAKHPPQSEQFL